MEWPTEQDSPELKNAHQKIEEQISNWLKVKSNNISEQIYNIDTNIYIGIVVIGLFLLVMRPMFFLWQILRQMGLFLNVNMFHVSVSSL